MRSMTMCGLVLAASMLAGGAHAASVNTTISCSQSLALNALGSGLRIDCQGALSISGGSIVSEGALSLYSDTSITLADVLLQADSLALYAPVVDSQGSIQLQGDTVVIESWDSTTGAFPTPVNTSELTLLPGSAVVFSQPSSHTGSQLTITQPASSTTVGLDTNGTLYLSNPGGVRFGANGTISVSAWTDLGAAPTLQLQAGVVPEPSTWALLATGLGMLAVSRHRQRG